MLVDKSSLMPLNMVPPGREVLFRAIHGGRGIRSKLADLGLTPGVKLKVISNGLPGPLIINLRGTRLALGYGIASKILVEH